MDLYRRSILDRSKPEWQQRDPVQARLVEAYEADLRAHGLIDFDDMPLLAMRALKENVWLRHALVAKYPILAVDEYQDLGRALHSMVMGLCFNAGMRLLAVGDVDQSIYGFTGANPELLQRLSERDDVETVVLGLNYRCGSRIVAASEYALGESRGYRAADGAAEGTVHFHPLSGSYASHAEYLCATLLPEIMARIPTLQLGQIAILYPAAYIGDDVANAAQRHGFGFIRTDGNALYPRSSRLMRWLEQCAIWCCGGWRTGAPRFSKLIAEGRRIFAEALVSEGDQVAFQRAMLAFLWERRDGHLSLHDWLVDARNMLLKKLISASRSLNDESDALDTFIGRLAVSGDVDDMTLGQFAGYGEGNDRINLSTLHSAKGREFDVVILLGIDNGRLPRTNASTSEKREARRLFYVGFTRARSELHMLFSHHAPSPFVSEVKRRLETEVY